MSSTKEQDVSPYQNEPLTNANAGVAGARLASGDARRRAPSTILGYLGPSGNPIALTGDEEAPFVKIIFDVPSLTPVSDIPQNTDGANGKGVLVASTIASSLHDFWVTDSRADTTAPRWIMLFDSEKAPTAGAVPSYAPIALCKTTGFDYDDAPWGFARGIVIAISTTSQAYTAITPAIDYSITARVLPRGI